MNNNCTGETIITLATATAIKISENKSSEELALLGSLFTVIGDQLALLSVSKSK